MPTDPRKRQKKLERRAAKRKEKKHQVVRQQSAGLSTQLTEAANYPILHCWIGNGIAEQGMGWVVLSRQLPKGMVAVASFLVDAYCLGVKDVFAEVLGGFSYDAKYLRRMKSEMASRSASPAEGRKLLEDAVAYARNIGLPPHPDYARAMLLFGDVNAAESDAEFTFGKDGKPFFFAGPRDTPERCRQIMAILDKTCGRGGYDVIIPVNRRDLDDALERGELRLIDEDEEFEEDE